MRYTYFTSLFLLPMNNFLSKVKNFSLYVIGITIIVSAMSTMSEYFGVWSMLFLGAGVMILPNIYTLLKKRAEKGKQNRFTKSFTRNYIVIIVFGLILGHTNSLLYTESDKPEVIANTSMIVGFNDGLSYTTGESKKITISHTELSELNINGENVDIQGSGWIEEIPVVYGENLVTIKGSNKYTSIIRTGSVDRITLEEEPARKELEIKLTLERKQEEVQIAKNELQASIDSINKSDLSQVPETATLMQMQLALYGGFALLIEKHKYLDDPEINRLSEELNKTVSRMQSIQLPLMRKNYADIIKVLLRESDVDVYTIGGDHGTIELVGGIFAANRNKKEIYSSMSEMLELLRFGRVNFKRYKYDDEYTYREIDGGLDSEVSVVY